MCDEEKYEEVLNGIREKIKSYSIIYDKLSIQYTKLNLAKTVEVLKHLKNLAGNLDFLSAMSYAYMLPIEERDVVFLVYDIVMTEMEGLRLEPDKIKLLDLYGCL